MHVSVKLFALAVLAGSALVFPALSNAGEPCCSVAAIDQITGKVTLKDHKTGKTYQVSVADKARLKVLKVGAQVDQDAQQMAR